MTVHFIMKVATMKRKAFHVLTARTDGNLIFRGMRRQRLCVQFIAGMSRRCVLRGALTQECCQNSVTAPRPDCKAHARFFR